MRELDEMRAAAGPCPRYGAQLVRPIVWGTPDSARLSGGGTTAADLLAVA